MAVIKIKGMTCNHCVMAVTRALNEIKGIKNVKVHLEKAEVFFEGESIDMDLVREKVKKAGYEVV
ncbi:MAG: cation transporter [Dissulfuribacterales bacterium]